MKDIPLGLRTVLGVAAGFALGLALGFVLRRLWPWVFAEAALGVALAFVFVRICHVRLDARDGRRAVLVAGVLSMIGVLLGRWLASGAAESPVAYVALMLETEPVFGALRLGVAGNTVLLVAQATLVVWVARVVGEAMSVLAKRSA